MARVRTTDGRTYTIPDSERVIVQRVAGGRYDKVRADQVGVRALVIAPARVPASWRPSRAYERIVDDVRRTRDPKPTTTYDGAKVRREQQERNAARSMQAAAGRHRSPAQEGGAVAEKRGRERFRQILEARLGGYSDPTRIQDATTRRAIGLPEGQMEVERARDTRLPDHLGGQGGVVEGDSVMSLPRYFEGDEWNPSSLPTERIIDLQNELVAAGIVAREDLTWGVWDHDSADAYALVLGQANRTNQNVEGAMTQLRLMYSEYGEDGIGGAGLDEVAPYVRRPFPAPVYEEPSPETLAEEVQAFVQGRAGRDLTDDEIAAVVDRMEGNYRAQFEQDVNVLRMEHEAGEDAAAAVYDASNGLAPLDSVPGEVGGGEVRDFNAEAANRAMLAEQFKGLFETRKAREADTAQGAALQASMATTDRLIG